MRMQFQDFNTLGAVLDSDDVAIEKTEEEVDLGHYDERDGNKKAYEKDKKPRIHNDETEDLKLDEEEDVARSHGPAFLEGGNGIEVFLQNQKWSKG